MSSILPAGTTLKTNTYRIQRFLGQGGFGAIYWLVIHSLIESLDSMRERSY